MSYKNSGYLLAVVFLVMLSVTTISILKEPEETLFPIEFSSLLELTNDQAVKSSIIAYLVNNDNEPNTPTKIIPTEQAETLYNITLTLGDIREINTTSKNNETLQRNVRFFIASYITQQGKETHITGWIDEKRRVEEWDGLTIYWITSERSEPGPHIWIPEDENNSKIPEKLINTTQVNPVDLTEYKVIDPDDSIKVTENTVNWTHMDKKLERKIYTELSPQQQIALVTEFSFALNEFTNTDNVNSRIVSFWMLGETIELGVIGNRSFTQLYAEQVPDSVSRYKLVLHQRVAGPNTFISVGPVLNVTQRYYVRLYVYNSLIMYQVSDSSLFETNLFESRVYDMVPREYRYLMFSIMFQNPQDRMIWSSGNISDVKIS